MPFTLSHAATVIPVKKIAQNHLPFAALVVGSFSPDFKYFFPLIRLGIFSHSLSGIFLFCLPLSLIILWLFHTLVREPLLQLLPVSLQNRINPNHAKLSLLPLRKFTATLIAILIGALTHIMWDAFTHEHGRVVESWPVLGTIILRVPTYDLTIYSLLQHLSTLFGLALLAYWFRQWFVKAPIQINEERMYLPGKTIVKIWVMILLSSFIFGICLGSWKAMRLGGAHRIPMFVVQTMIGWMLGLVIFVLFYSVFYKWSGANFFKERLKMSRQTN